MTFDKKLDTTKKWMKIEITIFERPVAAPFRDKFTMVPQSGPKVAPLRENPKTVEEVYEPYLIKEGYIQRTSRGRIALEKTYKYLNIEQEN